MKNVWVWMLCLVLLPLSVVAQTTGKGVISGAVTDSTGAAVPGAQVKLDPSGATAVSDPQGQFSLPGVPAGHYTISVSYVGFQPLTQQADLTAGQAMNVELKMAVASSSEEILVTAERPHGEAEAINETRTSENILQVLPAEVITSLPNANVADAIGRLPSVNLYRIEGEGVYVQVRGTEPRLTNVTVNGITIPSPEPTVRQVRLDVLPSDLVEAVEINKTLSARQDADGIAGSVNLRTKEAGEQPTLNLFGNGGYNSIENGRGSYGFGGTAGRRFGKDHKFGVLFNGAFDYNGRGIDNIQPSLDPRSTLAAPFYDNDTIREYRYYRYRYGFAGSTDYKFNNDHSIYASGIYSDFKDWGDKWYYSPISTPISSSGALPNPAAASTKAPKFYTSSKRPNASVGALILGGRHAFPNSILTWTLSAARSYEVDSAGNPKADFSWVPSTIPNCNFSPAAQSDLQRPTFGVCDGANSPLQNSANWKLADITTSKGQSAQLNLGGAMSFAHSYESGGHFGTFELGFKVSNGHKYQNATEAVYDSFGSYANQNALLMGSLQSDFNNTNFYDGSYFGGKFSPVSDFNLVQTYTQNNLSGFLDPQKTEAATDPNIFSTIERIVSGYVMNTISLGKLRVQTGLRFEGTQMRTHGNVVNFFGKYNAGPPPTYTAGTATKACTTAPFSNCWTVTPTDNNPGYIDPLPSVQLHYQLTPNSALRAVAARGIARPDAYQLVPYITEDSTASPVAVTIGNPGLRPTHANSYDLLYENFLHPVGMIQAGFFVKQLSAPQLLMTIPGGLSLASFPAGYFPVATQQAISQYPGDAITQYVNGENAWLWGFELSYQQHMSYLPGFLGGFGVSANYSYTKSKEKGVPLRSDQPTLIDQAPNTWNLGPTYDTKRFSARVGLAYNGASLFSYNYVSPQYVSGSDVSGLGPKGPSGDVYTLTHFQVDAQASYRFWNGLSANVSGLNLNNEVFGYYTGSTQFVNQREYYKPTVSFGLKYNYGSKR